MDSAWPSCAWAPGEDLSGPHVHRPRSPLLDTPLQELGTRTCPVKWGAWVGGLVGPFSDGHTQVSGWVRWPAATHRGHHATVAPFWGLRCPRGGWVRGGGRRDKDMWDGGPGPWVPPRGGVGVMPRGEAAGDCPGCQQAQCRPPQAGYGIPAALSQNTAVGGGAIGTGAAYSQAWSPRSRYWGPPPLMGSGVSQSHATPSPSSVSAVTSSSPPCVCVQIPPMRTPHIQVSDLVSTPAPLRWPICTQSPILTSQGVRLPGPLEVTNPDGPHSSCGCVGGGAPGRNPGASRRKWCPDSERMDGQAEARGRPRGGQPCPPGSEESLEGRAGAGGWDAEVRGGRPGLRRVGSLRGRCTVASGMPSVCSYEGGWPWAPSQAGPNVEGFEDTSQGHLREVPCAWGHRASSLPVSVWGWWHVGLHPEP